MLVKIDAAVIKYIMEKLESVPAVSHTECDGLNKSQLSTEVMKRERIINDVWHMLDSEIGGN